MDDNEFPQHNMTENRYPVDEATVQAQAEWMAGQGGSLTSRTGRKLSERVSRRSMISRIGKWTMGVSGVALISTLPVTRSAFAQEPDGSCAGTWPRTALSRLRRQRSGRVRVLALVQHGRNVLCRMQRRRCHHLRPRQPSPAPSSGSDAAPTLTPARPT